MRSRDGDAAFDCESIIAAMYRDARTALSPGELASKWNLLWHDLVSKSQHVDERSRAAFLNTALASLLPVSLRPQSWKAHIQSGVGRDANRYTADVVICCVLQVEFNSTLAAFGINLRKKIKADAYIWGHRFYRAKLATTNCGRITIWIGLIGEARNVNCANFCRDLFEVFSIRYACMLVGIAAGRRAEVSYGDVVAAHMVLDIEGARIEELEEKPRYRPIPLRDPLRTQLFNFAPDQFNWLSGRKGRISFLATTGAKVPKAAIAAQPKYERGIIASGEKLRRDSPLERLARRHGDEIIALEMEGAGFAATCDHKRINWLVFRGVSDYANMKKSGSWQAIAALHAALAARAFLENGLQIPVERGPVQQEVRF